MSVGEGTESAAALVGRGGKVVVSAAIPNGSSGEVAWSGEERIGRTGEGVVSMADRMKTK